MSKNRNRNQVQNTQATQSAPVTEQTVDQNVNAVLTEDVRESEQATAPEDVKPAVDVAPVAEDVQVEETAEEENAIVVPVAEEGEQGVFNINPFTGEPDVPEGPVAEEAEPAPYIAAPEVTKSTTAQFLLAELEQYAENMKRGKYILPKQGAMNQLKLFRLQQRVFNNVSDEDFEECLTVLLDWYDDNSEGVTSDTSINRFMAEWTGTKQDAEAFIRFNSLLVMLAAPGARRPEVLKTVNVKFYLNYGLTASGRERLIAYFGQ